MPKIRVSVVDLDDGCNLKPPDVEAARIFRDETIRLINVKGSTVGWWTFRLETRAKRVELYARSEAYGQEPSRPAAGLRNGRGLSLNPSTAGGSISGPVLA